MDFGHDTACALATVVDLVNTDPEVAGDEAMADLADLDDLVRRREISEAGPLTGDDLAAVLRLRARLRAVFGAEDEAAAVRPRRLAAAHPLLRARRPAGRAPRRGLRHGTGVRARRG